MKIPTFTFSCSFSQTLAMAALVLSPLVALGQTTPDIAVRPWQDGPHWAETVDELLFSEGGHVKGSGANADAWIWYSSGRIRVDRNDPDPRLVIGYQINTVTMDSDLPSIDGDYWDISLAASYRFDFTDDWDLVIMGGAGTANDGHFSNEYALYGIANVHAVRTLADKSTLHLGLRYEGNALVLPYVPWPYFAWEKQWNDNLASIIGLPFSSVRWKPLDFLVLDARYRIPVTLTGRAEAYVMPKLSFFGEYRASTDAFYIDGTKDDRLFYNMRRLQGGIHWVNKWVDLETGIGYAFEREFERGDTIDSTRNVADISEEPYFFLTLKGTF